jgi:hypothetical protein
MAYVVMTTTTNTIKCDNGVYAGINSALGTIQKKATFRKDEIFRVSLSPAEDFCLVMFKSRGNSQFVLTFDLTTIGLKVDSIDGVAPTSNSDLYDKLIALIA